MGARHDELSPASDPLPHAGAVVPSLRGLARGALVATLVGVVVYGCLLAYGDLSRVFGGIAGVGLASWLWIFALATLNYVLRLVRWNVYLRALGITLPPGYSALVFFAGFAMSITPAKLGEVLKSALLRESHGIPIARTAPIVVAERVTDLLGLVAMMAVGALRLEQGAAISAGAALVGAALLVLSSSRTVGVLVEGALRRLPLARRAAPTFAEVHAALLALSTPRLTVIAVLLSTAAWSAHGVCLYAVVEASTRAHVDLVEAALIYAAPLLASTLALLPGGLGLAEASMTGLLVELGGDGMTPAAAAAVTMVVRGVTFWWAVLLGVGALLAVRVHAGPSLRALIARGGLSVRVLDLWRKLSLAALLALAAAAIVWSPWWPIQHDAPLLFYPAWLAWTGQRLPYRQIFELNQPLSYVLYGFIGSITHFSDVLLRFVDLACNSAAVALGVALLPRRDRLAGLWGGALFFVWLAYHHGQDALQRELFVLLLALLGAVAVLRVERRALAAGVLGLSAGAAMLIKPHALIAFAWLAVWLLRDARRAGSGKAWPLALGFAAGLAVPVAAVLAWMVRIDALAAWRSQLSDYLPLYGAMSADHVVVAGSVRLLETLKGLARALSVAGMATAAVWLRARVRGSGGLSRELQLLVGLTLAFAVYPVPSGQFWRYHLLPLCFTAALLFGTALLETWPERSSRSALVFQALVALFCLRTYAWGSLYSFGTRSTEQRTELVDTIVRELRPQLQPGDTVQPLDWSSGAVAALLRLRAPMATDFMYDFQFYHHVSTPFIQGVRRRFMEQLASARPRFVVEVIRDDKPWPSGPDTTREFPELARHLDAHYRVSLQNAELRIWQRDDAARSRAEAASAHP